MKWMCAVEQPGIPCITVFRNCFFCGDGERLQLEFSGDEQCRLFLDGEYLVSAPEYSHISRLKKQQLNLELTAGNHILTAEILCFGPTLPLACQQSLRHGFFCRETSQLLKNWECRIVPRISFRPADPQYGTTLRTVCELTEYAASLNGTADDWHPVEFFEDERPLLDPELPELQETPVTRYRRIGSFFIFEKYECLRMEIEFCGRGTAEISWRESVPAAEDLAPALRETLPEVRPDILDVYPPAGEPVWWKPYTWYAGRLLEVRLTRNLKIRTIRFFQQNFPLPKVNFSSCFSAAEQELLYCSWDTLKCCLRDIFLDCPYYERRQYIGDTRVEALALATVCGELRPMRKALSDFAAAALPDGTLPCSSPFGIAQRQTEYDPDVFRSHFVIPGYESIYLQMAHDYALFSRDRAFLTELLPTLRRVFSLFQSFTTADGQLHLPGWNFLDWLPEYNWENGCAPHTEDGSGATLHWLTVSAVQDLMDLELWLGNKAAAAAARKYADFLQESTRRIYWDNDHSCYAEDVGHTVFSEHANAAAMLAAPHPELVPAMVSGDLIPAGIYFSFYILEACSRYQMKQLFESRKAQYLETAKISSGTMPEVFPSGHWQRSRCHGWSSHMLYHLLKKKSFLERLSRE